jgi:hypothetical protein
MAYYISLKRQMHQNNMSDGSRENVLQKEKGGSSSSRKRILLLNRYEPYTTLPVLKVIMTVKIEGSMEAWHSCSPRSFTISGNDIRQTLWKILL